ncbi:MAG: beta-N-acetylhexosaminidase [Alphaproteobacteria bacterium]
MAPDATRCPAIFGVEGLTLRADERAFFEVEKPLGFILFARNIDNPDQVKALVRDLKSTVGEAPSLVLIDQEGGRVARLRQPHWPEYPKGADFGERYGQDPQAALKAIKTNARLIADDLAALGINVDCLPILDVRAPDGHDVIGDRAYGSDPEAVAALGRAVCEGLLEGGVLPVIKHMPGHGRAMSDSHHELPVVDAPLEELEKTDFAPFQALADMPLGMTGHLLFTQLDREESATTSSFVIKNVMRGFIGFDGLLMSDDLNMEALEGTLGERAARAQAAGCDVALHCNGNLEEMRQVAEALSPITDKAMARFNAALALLKPPEAFDRKAAVAERNRLLAVA